MTALTDRAFPQFVTGSIRLWTHGSRAYFAWLASRALVA
jgi:hypothetical protein